MKTDTPPPAAEAPRQIGAESLDDLAREAAASPDPAAAPPPHEPAAEIMEPRTANQGLAYGCRALVAVLGNLACRRAGVDTLTEAETIAAGDALAGVAVYYLPTDGDPRVMAWATLALTLASIAGPRMKRAEEGVASPA